MERFFAQEQTTAAYDIDPNHALDIQDLKIHYPRNAEPTVVDFNMCIPRQQITALIGPSGCGKSSVLRSLNQMHGSNNHQIPPTISGTIYLADYLIFDNERDLGIDKSALRGAIGIVEQTATVFPQSIFDNVAYGPRLRKPWYYWSLHRRELQEIVQQSLEAASLWDEVKDRLEKPASGLSGGQKQRVCIARTLATNPSVLLMDEPCSALDPGSTARIEDLMTELKERVTILIVTHNMEQASRVADNTGLMQQGRLVEYGPSATLFKTPVYKETEDFVTGRYIH